MLISLIFAVFASSVQSCEAGYYESGPYTELPCCPLGYGPAIIPNRCVKTVGNVDIISDKTYCPPEPSNPPLRLSNATWKFSSLEDGKCTWTYNVLV
jgi:hypothetical protein